jgi:hypothetical protein
MADDPDTTRRILHVRFTLAGTPEQVLPMLKTAAPFYQFFGDAKVRLLQNVDDPRRVIQVIEYDAPASAEQNRHQIAGDPKVQAYLQAWRLMMPGAIEVDVYLEV